MGQDAMPTSLSGPSFSSDLPPRERVFLRGLYTDVEARLGRVDSGIDALRRRVRDFDNVLDGQIRRCESAECRVRSLRDDFSRMDREISEMSAELGCNSEAEGTNRQAANEDDLLEGEFHVADTSVNCNIQVGSANSEASRENVNSELRSHSSTELFQTMETLDHGSATNVTNRDETPMRARKNQETVSKSSESIPCQSGHNDHRQLQDDDSDETQHAIDSDNRQLRNRYQLRDGDNGGISIQQDNNAVSIGVVCNIHDPTANGQGRPNMASCNRPTEGHNSREMSRAEQQLVDLARDLTEFRKTVSASASKVKSDDCLVKPPGSPKERSAVGTAQHAYIGHGATGTQTAVRNANELQHLPITVGIEYAEFDRYVEEIIKRHSQEISQDSAKTMQTVSVQCDEEQKKSELDNIEPLKQKSSILPAEVVTDETNSPSDPTQPPEPNLNEGDLTSSSTAEGYTTCDEGDSSCRHVLNSTCRETGTANSNPSASEGECCHQATTSRPRPRCLELLCEQAGISSGVDTNPCTCCLRDMLATYVRHFLQLLHSRVTQEVKKRSKVKQKVRQRDRVTDADISRARDAVFGRLGLTIPMLEVLTEFDQHHQTGPEDQARVHPAHITDDEIHRLLVTMGMSWHTINNQLHDNDCAFRIAIATVHAHMHHMD